MTELIMSVQTNSKGAPNFATAEVIDAVEVVRCKDCIYGKIREVDDKVLVYCDYQFDWWNTDGYCSYGERKDERSRR